MYSVTITLAKLVCLHGDDMILELRVIFVVAYIFIFSILPIFFCLFLDLNIDLCCYLPTLSL